VHVQNTGDHEFREENAVVDNAVDHDTAEKAFEQYEARHNSISDKTSKGTFFHPRGRVGSVQRNDSHLQPCYTLDCQVSSDLYRFLDCWLSCRGRSVVMSSVINK
jgi:hypothetical protein